MQSISRNELRTAPRRRGIRASANRTSKVRGIAMHRLRHSMSEDCVWAQVGIDETAVMGINTRKS